MTDLPIGHRRFQTLKAAKVHLALDDAVPVIGGFREARGHVNPRTEHSPFGTTETLGLDGLCVPFGRAVIEAARRASRLVNGQGARFAQHAQGRPFEDDSCWGRSVNPFLTM